MSCYHINTRRKTRRGFTLVELLVVIVIIGILAALIVVAVNGARASARRAVIKQQISQVEGALARYLQKYGEYPPDFSDEAAVMRHVRKRWPNWRGGPQNFNAFCGMVGDATRQIDPAWEYNFHLPDPTAPVDHDNSSPGAHIGALAFWLGGLPDKNGMLSGFSADVSDPLGLGSGGIKQWDKDSQFMELTIGSNCEITVEGLPVITANGFPIAYFKPNAAGKYLRKNDPSDPFLCFHLHFDKPEWSDMGIAAPYAKKPGATLDDVVWHNPKTYQLIHPGLDGRFCDGDDDDLRIIDPANDFMKNITLADRDNQANFGGVTIESAGN